MTRISTYGLASNRESQINKTTSIALILYIFSLPLNGVEWDVIGVERFEIKITMITFLILFIAWFMKNILFQRKRTAKEKLFYFLTFIYASSQFLSLINSPLPLESLKQAVIIACYLTMMIIVSDTVTDRELTTSVLTVMGALSFILSITGVITYYFFNNNIARLGASGTNLMGIFNFRSGPYYFGDILLWSSGAVFFLTLKYVQIAYTKFISIIFLVSWFSAVILTYTKGLIIAVISFLILAIFLLKVKRVFFLLCLILFIVAIFGNARLTNYVKENKIVESTSTATASLFLREKYNSHQQNIFGYRFLYTRYKLIEVSLIKSIDFFWFGHGAGTSKIIFPEMIFTEMNKEKVVSDKRYDPKKSKVDNWLIGSHVFFITEFFNIGIIGTIALSCLVFLVLKELFKIVKNSVRENDYIPSLLLTTIIAMLVFRLSGSLIAIPFLWFILGFGFGVSQNYK